MSLTIQAALNSFSECILDKYNVPKKIFLVFMYQTCTCNNRTIPLWGQILIKQWTYIWWKISCYSPYRYCVKMYRKFQAQSLQMATTYPDLTFNAPARSLCTLRIDLLLLLCCKHLVGREGEILFWGGILRAFLAPW